MILYDKEYEFVDRQDKKVVFVCIAKTPNEAAIKFKKETGADYNHILNVMRYEKMIISEQYG